VIRIGGVITVSLRDFEYVELLEIAVAVGCPNSCLKYCPQEVLNKAYKSSKRMMSFEDFKKILVSVPKTVYLDFAGLTEPFVNPDFVRMAQYARDKGFQFGVKTTLVNASVESIRAVAETKPCCVFIHIPDGTNFVAPDDDLYRKALVAGFKYFRNAVTSVMNDLFATNNRETTARGIAKTRSGAGWCYRREHPQMVVFPDGTTVICCIDMGLKHVVGNLLTESYSVLRRRFVSKKSYPICAECSYNVPVWKFKLRKILRGSRYTLGWQLPLWKGSV
jgi:hypothetical protein